jgi:hypothetical protein
MFGLDSNNPELELQKFWIEENGKQQGSQI